MQKKWILICVGLAAAGAAVVAGLVASRKAQAPPPAPIQAAAPRASADSVQYPAGAAQLTMIRAAAIAASAVPLTDPLNARIVYDEDVTSRIGVGISGRIVAVKVAPGDTVRAGQVLAEIDSPDFGTALADLDKARTDEEHKRQVHERAKALGAGEGIAAKDVEIAQADLAQARAEVRRADLRLKNLNPANLPVHGQRIALVSPMNGIVTERTATPALEVGPSLPAPLFVVTDSRRLWLMIDLPERLLPHVRVGSMVSVDSEAYPGERFTAKIAQLGPLVDPNTRRVPVRARLENPGGKLLPEMFVRAAILQNSDRGVQVPNSAVVHRGVYSYVFVETAPGQFQSRQVQLLTQGAESSYVGEGLHGGEKVVITGAMLLDAELSARAGSKP